MQIKLTSIVSDSKKGVIIWIFTIQNKSGYTCDGVSIYQMFLSSPDNTSMAPTNLSVDPGNSDSWPMDVNQIHNIDIYFTQLTSSIRYTLSFNINYMCNNMSEGQSDNYRAYDFYFA